MNEGLIDSPSTSSRTTVNLWLSFSSRNSNQPCRRAMCGLCSGQSLHAARPEKRTEAHYTLAHQRLSAPRTRRPSHHARISACTLAKRRAAPAACNGPRARTEVPRVGSILLSQNVKSQSRQTLQYPYAPFVSPVSCAAAPATTDGPLRLARDPFGVAVSRSDV